MSVGDVAEAVCGLGQRTATFDEQGTVVSRPGCPSNLPIAKLPSTMLSPDACMEQGRQLGVTERDVGRRRDAGVASADPGRRARRTATAG